MGGSNGNTSQCPPPLLAEKRCSTGSMETKLIQQLAFLGQCLLCGIFLGLCKAYIVIDRNHYLKIMKDCGVRFKTLRLI